MEIIKSTGAAAKAEGWGTPEGLKAVASIISAIVWPMFALVLIVIFRAQLRNIFERVTEFKVFGIEGKIRSELTQSAQAAEQSKGLSNAPTPGELQRAVQVETLASSADLALIRRQVDELAAEYIRVRGSMAPSDTRTRAMEVVVAKMRTIGRAAYPLRHELAYSPSPGHRLQAIAALQVLPDFEDFLIWLADRLDVERPFLAYHALVALNVAAADDRAAAYLPQLETALERVMQKAASYRRDASRAGLADALRARVASLQAKLMEQKTGPPG